MINEIVFNSDCGRIEARYHHGPEATSPAALLLHPHPLHGGTMNNKVIYNVFHTLIKNGFSVLRFNFRGVGKSLGEFDHGVGELVDASVALDVVQSRNPEAMSYWVMGFSFGAWIGMQLLMRRPEVDGFVSIAPPASSYDFNFLTPCPTPGLIIQGTDDDIAKEADSYALYEKLKKQKHSQVEYLSIQNADHFFKDHMNELTKGLEEFVNPRIIRKVQTKKVRRDRKRKVIEYGSC